MTEISIKFYALNGSPYMRQAGAYGKTVLLLPESGYPTPRKVLAVLRNGVPLRFDINEAGEIEVPHIKPEGDRMEIRMEGPQESQEAPLAHSFTQPPVPTYGLSRASLRDQHSTRNPNAWAQQFIQRQGPMTSASTSSSPASTAGSAPSN